MEWSLTPAVTGDFEGARGVDIHALVEVAVAAHAPGLVRLDGVADLVGGVAVDAVVLPGRLARRVVGHLVLEEDRLAVLAVPDQFVLLIVLDEQAVGRDVVAVDDHAGIGGVYRSSRRRCRGRPARPRCRRG